MNKKRFLTETEHEQLGALVARMCDDAMAIFLMTGTVYKSSSQVDRKARRAKEALDALRCVLDSQVTRDLPGRDYAVLNKLYYGDAPRSRASLIPTPDEIRQMAVQHD